MFHEDLTSNVTSRVLTRKTAPPPGRHFHEDWTIDVKTAQHPNDPNVLTNVNEDWTIHLTSRVLTRKTAATPGGHVFIPSTNVMTNFELDRDIIGTNLWTKFHEDQTKSVASRELTRQNVDDARWTTDDARRTTHDRHKVIPKAHQKEKALRSVYRYR
ncbi:hypothetical protein DPMN_092499 [Dreissena polymorpha]|uniref:Uncharacterized protein n=1 Tax=Dreissena polymorpha TaxID=45954 RepID=A0A9D4R0Y4_DREPO|nr:hypothetical protein DPMN_092499 [Dreissena polymorpha]